MVFQHSALPCSPQAVGRPSLPTVTLWCMVLAACLVGCGRNDRPLLAKAGGLVMFQGKPLPAGRVSFVPDSSRGTKGRAATGIIQPDGRFTLQSYAPGDGVIVGFHRVAIESLEESASAKAPENDSDPPTPWQPLKSRIPTRYNDHAASGLTAEVKAGQSNEFEFVVEPR